MLLVCIGAHRTKQSSKGVKMEQRRSTRKTPLQHHHKPRKHVPWELQHRPNWRCSAIWKSSGATVPATRRRSACRARRLGFCSALQHELHAAAAPDARLVGPELSFEAQNVRKRGNQPKLSQESNCDIWKNWEKTLRHKIESFGSTREMWRP